MIYLSLDLMNIIIFLVTNSYGASGIDIKVNINNIGTPCTKLENCKRWKKWKVEKVEKNKNSPHL